MITLLRPETRLSPHEGGLAGRLSRPCYCEWRVPGVESSAVGQGVLTFWDPGDSVRPSQAPSGDTERGIHTPCNI